MLKHKSTAFAQGKLRRFALPVLMLAALVAACSTVPLTGRSQLSLVSDSAINQLSFDSYKQVLSESKLSDDAAVVARVRGVGDRIARASERFLRERGASTEGFAWEFNVIQDDEMVNAWAMPGGKVAVYTGILPLAPTDDDLAVVMGHEVAHVLARHGNERMSQALAVQMGGTTLSYALQTNAVRATDLYMQLYGLGSQVGVLLPYSRLQEAEADRIGLSVMAMAGYDPRVAPAFWGRMNTVGGARPPEFLSTHPAPDTRIQKIQEFMPEALSYYKP